MPLLVSSSTYNDETESPHSLLRVRTASEVRTLAARLGALLPDRRIVVGLRDQATQHRVADALHAACRQGRVGALMATIISETLSSYLYGWEPDKTAYGDPIAHAVAVLNLAAGGTGGAVVQVRPTGTTLTDRAIMELVRTVLLLD